MDYRELNDATCKNHFPLLSINQMLDRLLRHTYYYFLDGYSAYNQIAIALSDQEKTTFTRPYGYLLSGECHSNYAISQQLSRM